MSIIQLPLLIQDRIEKIILESNSSTWLKSAVALSLKYRGERVSHGINYIRDYSDVLGYLALRSTSTYAQIFGALSDIQEITPIWKPTTLLDIGSGPGTALWAAGEIFPSIIDFTAIEKDNNFITAGKKIFLKKTSIKLDWQHTNLAFSLPRITKKYDLVILANVLNEMDNQTQQKTIEFAYRHCHGVLVIIEPGTPFGNESIQQAVIQLSKYNPKIITPFIDNTYFPDEEIIFSQRVLRPEYQKRVRQLQRKMVLTNKIKVLPPSDWEDATYHYIAFSKFKPEISPISKLVTTPLLFKPFIELTLLTKNGIKKEKIYKTDRVRFKTAKKLHWGDISY